MKKNKVQLYIIALMLMTFIGQALASTSISCTHEMPMDHSTMFHDNMISDVNHADMMLENNENYHNQQALMDCCQEQCKCPLNGCLSLYIPSDTQFNAEIIAEQKIVLQPVLHKLQIHTSLYRPPIS